MVRDLEKKCTTKCSCYENTFEFQLHNLCKKKETSTYTFGAFFLMQQQQQKMHIFYGVFI